MEFFQRSILNIFDCHVLCLLKWIVHLRSIFDGLDFIWLFSKASYWIVFSKYFIPQTCLMDLISCYFSPKVLFKYLETRYWTVFKRCAIPGHIWWIWFYETFFKGPFYIFWSKILDLLFFLSGFFFTDTDDSQDSRGREETIFYSTLPYPPAHEHSDI